MEVSCEAIPLSSDLGLELNTALELCMIADTPRSLAVYILLRNGEYQQYVDLDMDPDKYLTAESFRNDYLVTKVLSKSPNLPLRVDRAQVAIDSFYESEADCSRTNDRLWDSPCLSGEASIRRIIESILGKLTTKDLSFVSNNFRHGSGSTTGVSGTGTVLSDKYDEEIHLTHHLLPFFSSITGERWRQITGARIVDGNKFTTVPKNSKTDRGICIEPTLNIYCQLGAGALIRNRLLVSGCDLSDQSQNRKGARNAIAHDLCTIDLSRASDLIAFQTVSRLLPPRWFHLLELLRSQSTTMPDGSIVKLSKFSSMGNGFTFELESLIFLAICRSIVPEDLWYQINVYGDDIVIPRAFAPEVIDTLHHFGMSVNREKSFLAGSFFESCGADWFENQPVRPFFLKGSNGNQPYALQIANRLRDYSSIQLDGEYCDSRYRNLWKLLLKQIPRDHRRCRVPPHLGDLGLITSMGEATTSRPKNGLEGVTVKVIRYQLKTRKKASMGRLLEGLTRWGVDRPTYGKEPVRGLFGRPTNRQVVVQPWQSFRWV